MAKLPAPHTSPGSRRPSWESNLGPGGGGGGRVCWDRPASQAQPHVPEGQRRPCVPDPCLATCCSALLTSVNSLELYLPPWLLPCWPPVCMHAPSCSQPHPGPLSGSRLPRCFASAEKPVMGTELLLNETVSHLLLRRSCLCMVCWEQVWLSSLTGPTINL